MDRILQGTLNALPTVISGGASGAGSVLAAISGSLITVIDPYDAANLMLRAVRVVRNMTMSQRVRSDEDLEMLLELSEDLPDNGKIRETIDLLRKRAG